tara:strand:+ start:204 stop:434 length:231 start_codon:yes stop_codon:yes gene_type:complete
MFAIFKKWLDSVVKSYDKVNKPVKKKVIVMKDLAKKNKKELERIGRKLGIELDRRLTKLKLINKIKFRARMNRKYK